MRCVITGEPTLDMVLRALNRFAIHEVAPSRIELIRSADEYTIIVQDEALSADLAWAIMEKIRAHVSIWHAVAGSGSLSHSDDD